MIIDEVNAVSLRRHMRSIRLAMIAISVLCLRGMHAEAQEESVQPDIEKYLALVNQEYSGLRALDTTGFVARYWRIPGNKGFNESIFRVESILQGAGYVLENLVGAWRRDLAAAPLSFVDGEFDGVDSSWR